MYLLPVTATLVIGIPLTRPYGKGCQGVPDRLHNFSNHETSLQLSAFTTSQPLPFVGWRSTAQQSEIIKPEGCVGLMTRYLGVASMSK